MKKEVKSNASNLHKQVFDILKEVFKDESIKQEELIKIDNKKLYLDIYFPRLKIAIECQGEQHFKFNKHFYSDASAFLAAKKNDELKRKYCEIEKITLVEVKFNEKIDKENIHNKILKALKG